MAGYDEDNLPDDIEDAPIKCVKHLSSTGVYYRVFNREAKKKFQRWHICDSPEVEAELAFWENPSLDWALSALARDIRGVTNKLQHLRLKYSGKEIKEAYQLNYRNYEKDRAYLKLEKGLRILPRELNRFNKFIAPQPNLFTTIR